MRASAVNWYDLKVSRPSPQPTVNQVSIVVTTPIRSAINSCDGHFKGFPASSALSPPGSYMCPLSVPYRLANVDISLIERLDKCKRDKTQGSTTAADVMRLFTIWLWCWVTENYIPYTIFVAGNIRAFVFTHLIDWRFCDHFKTRDAVRRVSVWRRFSPSLIKIELNGGVGGSVKYSTLWFILF